MQYAVTQISLEELKEVPEDLQIAYVAIGHISNDVSILLKLITRATLKSGDSEVARVSQILLSSFLMKLAAGRLNEGWETLNKLLNKLERDYQLISKMSGAIQEDWEALKRYFSHPNPIREVRRKLAFHSDTDQMLASIGTLPEGILLQDFLFKNNGNSMFGGAELAQLASISRILGTEDLSEGLDLLSIEIIEQARKVTNVCFGFLRVFYQEQFPEKIKHISLENLEFEPESIRTPLAFIYDLSS